MMGLCWSALHWELAIRQSCLRLPPACMRAFPLQLLLACCGTQMQAAAAQLAAAHELNGLSGSLPPFIHSLEVPARLFAC
jgi:hypothetical protein